MVVQVITPITVVAETLTASVAAGCFQTQGFAEAFETGEPGRDARVEVDQYLIMVRQGFVTYEDRGQHWIGLADAAVGQETLIVVGPE